MVRAVLVALVGATLLLLSACTSGASTSRGDRGSVDEEPAAVPTAVALGGINVEPGVVIAPTPTPDGPRPLVVASLLGETGVMAPFDVTALSGVIAEIDRLNEGGGVLGREVRHVRFNTDSRTSVAERTMSRLLDNPPDLVIVSCDVEFSAPILEIADEAGLITISPCADDVRYLTGALGARNFSMGTPPEARGVLAARSAFDRYGPSALVLRDVTSPEAIAFCNGFERGFREAGGTVIYRDEFNYDTLEPVQDRLADRDDDPDAIAICSHVPGEPTRRDELPPRAFPDIVNMVRTLGFQAPIVSGTGADQPDWFWAAPGLGRMTYVSWSSVYGNDPNDRINDLTERVRDLSDPLNDPLVSGSATILGAEAVEAWARAVEAARDPAPDRVAAALGSFNDEAFATGEISFVAGARMDIGRTYRIIEVRDGELNVIALEAIEP